MNEETQSPPIETIDPASDAHPATDSVDFKTQVATVGVIVVAAALIETALIPGMIVGAAAMLAPKFMPKMSAAMQPMFRSAVRGAYKFGRKAREAAAEAKEQMHDIVAEVHAEGASSETPKA
jgi:hypothetical protein